MNNVVFVTGNANKARYFSELVGMDIPHQKADVPEIQSLNPEEVVIAKAKAAFLELGRPVIVEDTSLIIETMGRLPGTFIKWFIDELSMEKLCRLADSDPLRKAAASAIFAYYDGNDLRLFKGSIVGSIAQDPRGSSGFGWNAIFIPDGAEKTLGEMDDAEFKKYYGKIKRFDEVKVFLASL